MFGERDIMEVHKDMEEAGVKRHLWLRWDSMGMNYVKPLAPYVFTQEEKQPFKNFVSEMRAPIGYVTTFKKHVAQTCYIIWKTMTTT